MLVENLGRSELKVLLCDVHPPLAQGIHASLCAHTLELSTRAAIHLLSNLVQIDTTGEIHLAAVNAENVGSGLDTGGGELDLAVDTSGTEKGGVENVETIGGAG
jgi:hypothetical protein